MTTVCHMIKIISSFDDVKDAKICCTRKPFFSAEMKEPLFVHSVCLVTDTEAERNALKEHIYPKLRDFCRENYGIEFQVKDVFSGCVLFVPAELVDFLVRQK